MVESQPSKLLVAGPIPVSRSKFADVLKRRGRTTTMAQQAPSFTVDRTTALYERPTMNIVDEPTFAAVKRTIEGCFAAASVEKFFKGLERGGLRVRNFEDVVNAGKLGAETAAQYASLSNADQGQIREFYLASLERVDAGVRDKFFKLYAYY